MRFIHHRRVREIRAESPGRWHAAKALFIPLLLLFALAGCGATIPTRYTYRANERVLKTDKDAKRVWTDKAYTLESAAVNLQRGEVTGYVMEKTTTALQTTHETVREYDLVTGKRRQHYVIEHQLAGVSSKYPERVILLPFGIAAGLIALPFELLAGHGMSEKSWADVPNYVEQGIVSRETIREKTGKDTASLSDYKTATSRAGSIPLVCRSSRIGLGSQKAGRLRITTDAEGRFAIPVALPANVHATGDAAGEAMRMLDGIFVDEPAAREFLRFADFARKVSAEITVETDARSLVEDAHSRAAITEDRKDLPVSAVAVSREDLMRQLAKYLGGIALAKANPKTQTITLAAKDSISHAAINGGVSIAATFVTGITKQEIRNAILAELQKYVKPAYAARYTPGDAELPAMLRLPERFTIGEAKTFRIHVPATFQIKATHPEYVFTEGQKEFTDTETSAIIYLADKGTKQRVTIDKGQGNGKIE